MQQIIFNGKTYNSLDEMPVNERQTFEHLQQIFVDANGNGIPDFMEGDIAQKVMTAFTGNVHLNGKVYENLNDLPPDAREKVQKAFDKLKQMGFAGDLPSLQGPADASAGFEPAFQPSSPVVPPTPAAQEGSGNRRLLIASFLAILLVCAAGLAVAIYLLR